MREISGLETYVILKLEVKFENFFLEFSNNIGYSRIFLVFLKQLLLFENSPIFFSNNKCYTRIAIGDLRTKVIFKSYTKTVP